MPEPITASQIFDRDDPLDFSSGQVDTVDFFNNGLVRKVNNTERILGLVEQSEERSQEVEDEFDNTIVQQIMDEREESIEF